MNSCALFIPSYKRSKTATSPDWFPSATLVVRESERAAYEDRWPGRVHAGPDKDLQGLAAVRNYCQRTFLTVDTSICMIDDDIYACSVLTAAVTRRLKTPDEFEAVIHQAALSSSETDARLFGFNQSLDLLMYKPATPFKLVGLVGSVVGVHYPGVQWDEMLRVRVDMDASLESLRRHRIVWIDTRYCFEMRKDTNAGGSSLLRSADTVARDIAYLRAKWGKYLAVDDPMDGYVNLIMRVKRKSKKQTAGVELDD